MSRTVKAACISLGTIGAVYGSLFAVQEYAFDDVGSPAACEVALNPAAAGQEIAEDALPAACESLAQLIVKKTIIMNEFQNFTPVTTKTVVYIQPTPQELLERVNFERRKQATEDARTRVLLTSTMGVLVGVYLGITATRPPAPQRLVRYSLPPLSQFDPPEPTAGS